LKKWGIKSVLIVPILSNHEAIGVFFFNYQRSVFEFQNCHVDFGVQLASSIAMALDNIKLIETLKGEVVVRKQAERDLARANASLEKRVLERTKELNEANEKLQSAYQELELVDEELKVQNDELEKALAGEKSLRLLLIQSEKYAALARLVGSVAHEINNPIQTVKNCLYLIQSEKTSKEAGAILNMAESELQRIANLVQQLRDTYRPSKLQPVDFSPIDMLNKVSGLLTGQMRENNVCWHLHHEENDLTIHGIPDQIQQVFLNICLNAIEAMSPKGGQLDVAVCRLPEEKKIRITFQDTGPGIPQSIIDQVFEPFYTTKTKGTGLGLAICYEIVKSHGGEIAVVSPPGTGATFDIVLPIQ
jgi:signal transduction histidine kinase